MSTTQKRRRRRSEIARRIVENELKKKKLISDKEGFFAPSIVITRPTISNELSTETGHDLESDESNSVFCEPGESTDYDPDEPDPHDKSNVCESEYNESSVCESDNLCELNEEPCVSESAESCVYESDEFHCDESDKSDISDSDSESQALIPMQNLQALFSSSELSGKHFSIALLSMMLKHSLTYSCMTDLLKLLSYSFPFPNAVPPTLYMLMNNLINYKECIILHYCCTHCTRPLAIDSSCQQDECKSAGSLKSSFIEVRLDLQLQNLYSGILLMG